MTVRAGGLHVVTDDAIIARPGFIDTARALLNLPLLFHLRAPQLSARDLHDLAISLRAGNLVINDRLDIALATGCTAVQLSARSIPLAKARAVAAQLRVGYSAHGAEEAKQAERAGADWVFVGTIYPSRSHEGFAPAGLPLVREASAATRIAVIAIGGVTAQRIPELREAGAAGAAVIRSVWDAPDPVQAAAEMVNMLA